MFIHETSLNRILQVGNEQTKYILLKMTKLFTQYFYKHTPKEWDTAKHTKILLSIVLKLVNNYLEHSDSDQDTNLVQSSGQIAGDHDGPDRLIVPAVRYHPRKKDSSNKMQQYLKQVPLYRTFIECK